jgi:hypothetical protein
MSKHFFPTLTLAALFCGAAIIIFLGSSSSAVAEDQDAARPTL